MKSFDEFLLEGKLKDKIRKFVGSTVATAALGVPLHNAGMQMKDRLFPSPWSQLQGYMTKHPKTGKLHINLDNLSDDQINHVNSLVDQLHGMVHQPKKS